MLVVVGPRFFYEPTLNIAEPCTSSFPTTFQKDFWIRLELVLKKSMQPTFPDIGLNQLLQ